MGAVLPIAIGLAGGLSSLFSGQANAKAINEKIRRAQGLAAESLIDNEELSSRLGSIDRMFNQRLTSTLNTTAIRSRGFANSGTIGAAVAGGIEGDRLASKSQTVNESLNFNKQVQQSIAQMELGTASANPIGDFVSGAASGVSLGMELDKLVNPAAIPGTTTTQQSIEAGQATPRSMSDAGNFNPWLKGQGVTTSMGTLNPMQLQTNNPYINTIAGIGGHMGFKFPGNDAFSNWGGWNK